MVVLIGKQFVISGMTLKIIGDKDDQWEALNLTTQETIFINKETLDKAIRFGKAEEFTDDTPPGP